MRILNKDGPPVEPGAKGFIAEGWFAFIGHRESTIKFKKKFFYLSNCLTMRTRACNNFAIR